MVGACFAGEILASINRTTKKEAEEGKERWKKKEEEEEVPMAIKALEVMTERTLNFDCNDVISITVLTSYDRTGAELLGSRAGPSQ